jgi:hypothetical protein
MDEKGEYLIAQGLVCVEEYLRNPREFEPLLELPAISSNPARQYRGAFGLGAAFGCVLLDSNFCEPRFLNRPE